MKSTFTYAGIILIFAAFAMSCMRPTEATGASEPRSNRKITPKEFPRESGSDDELVGLLQEQNKRLKAQVQRLEKENAELKAKLPRNNNL